MKKAIIYVRVSTKKQAKSGLGLEAQMNDCVRFANENGYNVIETFCDDGISGKIDPMQRIGLSSALKLAKSEDAEILCSKLCRLSREVFDVSNLMRQGVGFRVVEYPEAPPLVLHLVSALNQATREQISKLTKEALAVAKSRGVKLGTHRPQTLEKAVNARIEIGRVTAEKYRPHLINALWKAIKFHPKNKPTLTGMATMLMIDGILTPSGKTKWDHSSVRALLKRCEIDLKDQVTWIPQ